MKHCKIWPGLAAAALPLALLAGYWLLRPGPARWRGCNVVWIVSDALRRDILGCYGGDARTPHIDWLARNGVRFDNAYANASSTLPSSLALLTGRYAGAYVIGGQTRPGGPPRDGMFWVNPGDRLLAEVLRDSGYDAVANLENPLAGSANNVQGFLDAKRLPDKLRRQRQRPGGARGAPHPVFDKLLRYIATAPRSGRFMVLNWFYDPHAPYDPPLRFRERIPIASSQLRVDPRVFSGKTLARIREEFQRRNIPLDGADRAYLAALYKAEVESVDERVGRVLGILRRRDLLRRTIVIFTADHGEQLGENGQWSHGKTFRQVLVHVPLILFAPGLRGRVIGAPVAHVDLVPTLAEMLGVTPPSPGPQGRSFLPTLGKGGQPVRPVYFSNAHNQPGARDEIDGVLLDGYKLIAPKSAPARRCQLFHLPGDPDEAQDLSAADPAACKRLLAVIMERRREIERQRQANLRKLGIEPDLATEREALLRDLRRLGYL